MNKNYTIQLKDIKKNIVSDIKQIIVDSGADTVRASDGKKINAVLHIKKGKLYSNGANVEHSNDLFFLSNLYELIK